MSTCESNHIKSTAKCHLIYTEIPFKICTFSDLWKVVYSDLSADHTSKRVILKISLWNLKGQLNHLPVKVYIYLENIQNQSVCFYAPDEGAAKSLLCFGAKRSSRPLYYMSIIYRCSFAILPRMSKFHPWNMRKLYVIAMWLCFYISILYDTFLKSHLVWQQHSISMFLMQWLIMHSS